VSIAVFPDTTVFCNFAAVGKSDLLGEFLRDRGRWTEAVMSEVEQSRGYLPDLQRVLEGGWMGEPIVLDSTDEIGQVERIRRTGCSISFEPDAPPAMRSECPPTYLVSDITTMSAP